MKHLCAWKRAVVSVKASERVRESLSLIQVFMTDLVKPKERRSLSNADTQKARNHTRLLIVVAITSDSTNREAEFEQCEKLIKLQYGYVTKGNYHATAWKARLFLYLKPTITPSRVSAFLTLWAFSRFFGFVRLFLEHFLKSPKGPFNYFNILQQNGCFKTTKVSPPQGFWHYATYRRHFKKDSNVFLNFFWEDFGRAVFLLFPVGETVIF